MPSAFHGDGACRTLALGRLDERFQAGQITVGALFIGGGKLTPAAALVDSADAQTWQDTLGLAKWMAYAIDYACADLPTVTAVAFVRSLLDAITPGDDTTSLGSRIAETVLGQVAAALESRAAHVGPLTAACEQIRSLHRRAADDDMPTAAQWRAARKAATQATNALEESADQLLGACVEAAAWDPVAAPTTVGDVLRTWNKANASGANAAFGWTMVDDARVRAHLAEMFQKYKKDRTEEEEPRDVFQLLRQHHPELEARLLAYTRFQREYVVSVAGRTADLLVQAAGAAR